MAPHKYSTPPFAISGRIFREMAAGSLWCFDLPRVGLSTCGAVFSVLRGPAAVLFNNENQEAGANNEQTLMAGLPCAGNTGTPGRHCERPEAQVIHLCV